ncbi:kinase-like domain-containing protein [Mycena vulgaris]|nr:kinase-like domain-containing protein [Mycena vulgaris]
MDAAVEHPEPAIGTRSDQVPLRDKPCEHLHSSEIYWYNHRDWLEAKGYALRSRYEEDWTPSWKNSASQKLPRNYEDANVHWHGTVLDATRISDGAFVMLKWIDKTVHPFEVEIGAWFSTEPQRSDPENHCVPIYEVLQTPDNPNVQVIVMPLLTRYDKPRFDTIGEAVSFFRQIFEGLKYMHNQNVAHRDCSSLNIMMDASPIFTTPFHPVVPTMKRDFSGKSVALSRTQHPVQYYLTDFGISVKYRPEDRPPSEAPILGGDKSVPEFQTAIKRGQPLNGDPFPWTSTISETSSEGTLQSRKHGFEFLETLVADMVSNDPSLRPSMDEIVRGLSSWKLRSRVAKDRDSFSYKRATINAPG